MGQHGQLYTSRKGGALQLEAQRLVLKSLTGYGRGEQAAAELAEATATAELTQQVRAAAAAAVRANQQQPKPVMGALAESEGDVQSQT